MKKILLLLIMFCVICSGCAKKSQPKDDLDLINERGNLIVGVRTDAKPFGFLDEKGNFLGYDVDLAKYIAKYLLGNENKVKFVPVSASNRIMKLNSNEVDCLIATMSITKHRQQILNFSIPYYMAGQAILVKKDSKNTSLSDFENKKLIIIFGSTSEKNLRSNVPGIKVVGYKDYKQAFYALKNNKAEGIIADDTILLGFAVDDNSVKLLPKRYSKEPYSVTFRKDDKSKRFMQKVDYIIDDLQSSGKLNRLQEKWNIK